MTTMNNSITLQQIGWSVKGTASVISKMGRKEIVRINSLNFYGDKPSQEKILSQLSLGNYPCSKILSVKLVINELYEKMFENYSFGLFCQGNDLAKIN